MLCESFSAEVYRVGDRVEVRWAETGDVFAASITAVISGPPNRSRSSHSSSALDAGAERAQVDTSIDSAHSEEEERDEGGMVMYEVEYAEKVRGKTCRETNVSADRVSRPIPSASSASLFSHHPSSSPCQDGEKEEGEGEEGCRGGRGGDDLIARLSELPMEKGNLSFHDAMGLLHCLRNYKCSNKRTPSLAIA